MSWTRSTACSGSTVHRTTLSGRVFPAGSGYGAIDGMPAIGRLLHQRGSRWSTVDQSTVDQADTTETACCGLSRGSHRLVYRPAVGYGADGFATHSVTSSGVVSRCSPPASPSARAVSRRDPRASRASGPPAPGLVPSRVVVGVPGMGPPSPITG